MNKFTENFEFIVLNFNILNKILTKSDLHPPVQGQNISLENLNKGLDDVIRNIFRTRAPEGAEHIIAQQQETLREEYWRAISTNLMTSRDKLLSDDNKGSIESAAIWLNEPSRRNKTKNLRDAIVKLKDELLKFKNKDVIQYINDGYDPQPYSNVVIKYNAYVSLTNSMAGKIKKKKQGRPKKGTTKQRKTKTGAKKSGTTKRRSRQHRAKKSRRTHRSF